MKKFLKNWFINSVGLATLAWIFNGIQISFQIYDFFLTTLLLSIVIKLIHPLFELIFLPLNLLTLGFFRWLKTVFSLAILSYLIKYIQLLEFHFPGFSWNAIEVKSFTASPLISLIIASFLFNIIRKCIRWVIRGKKS